MSTNNQNTFEIVFCVAENTYMYLPLYLAKEKGIFESVIKHVAGYENYEIKITFVEPKSTDEEHRISQKGGDREAVEYMLSESLKDKPCKLFIAVADPVSVFKSYPKTNSKNDIKIIGQLINKFPFWIVGKYNNKFQECPHNKLGIIKDFVGKSFYYPVPRYITANACASYVVEENKISDEKKEPVNFGEVITKCIENDAIGLTGDLSKMAEFSVTNQISVMCHLANSIRNDGEIKNIATVLITESSSCQKYKKSVLPAVLEAIQNAIFIIYSSPQIALDVCQSVSTTYFSESRNDEKNRQIFSIIKEDELYPFSLDIKFNDWLNTIEFYLGQNMKPFDLTEFPKAPKQPGESTDFLIYLYKIMYEETPAKIVEKNMIEKFGVSCKTFDNEIYSYLKEKKHENRMYILNNYVNEIITFSLIMAIIIILIFYIIYVIHSQEFVLIAQVSFWVAIISLVLGINRKGLFKKIFKFNKR